MTVSPSSRKARQPLAKAPRAFSRLVVANWKMNPGTLGEAKELLVDIKKEAGKRTRVQTVIAVPYVYLADLGRLLTGTRTKLGAQDVFGEKEGTHTGEISTSMLASVGVSHVIIGHSERRARGEDNEAVARKVSAAVKEGLSVILCVGESARDTSGRYLTVIEQQLQTACAGVPQSALKYLSTAYEPVWAISSGTGYGQTATPEDVHEMTIFIKRILTTIYTRVSAERVPILYGGSVNEGNAEVLMQKGMVDGFLVGGASLKPRVFTTILTAANRQSK